VRALASREPYLLPDTTSASNPFWSPDGRTLAFFANGTLRAVDVSGGPSREIAEVKGTPAGGSWGARGVILFADSMSGLYAVPESGGAVRQVARVDHAASDHWYAWPQFLPDSRQFLYQVVAIDGSRAGVFAGSLDSPRSVRLLDASAATFAPPGYLLYVQHDILMAESLDLERMTLSGRPVLLARGLSAPSLAEGNVVSGSRELLAFREGAQRPQLMRVDRAGSERGGAIETPVALSNVRLSPDGGSLLATGSVTDAPGVWLIDLARQQQTRLSADGLGSVWSPDGRHIAYTTRGGRDLFVRSATDGDDARIVSTDAFVKVVNDWSPDGRQMIYAQIDAGTKLDLWSIPASGGTPTPLLKTPFNEAQARISPDGRWIAYVTEQSGRGEVWVRRYPQMDEPRQVSVGGGGQPQWRPDQSELFYLSPDHALMAVDTPGGARPSFGSPRRLFHTAIVGGPSDARDSYAVMPDGATFLVYGVRETTGPAPITLIRNWAAGLTPVAVAPAPEPRTLANR
jgi:Tol biopolymer transport system component